MKSANMKTMFYCDYYGNVIWSDNIIFKRLFAPSQSIIHEGKGYTVRRVAILGNRGIVNFDKEAEDAE